MTTARSRKGSARDERAERGIPEATVARLPVYLRALTSLADSDVATASSEDLAEAAGVNSAKLRKDLSYLGTYGTRGVGYDVNYLRYQIAREIGLTQDWSVVIIGIGNLGHALANYSGFVSRGFRVAALIDSDPDRVGETVGDLPISALDDLGHDRARARRLDRRDRHPGGIGARTSATGWSRPASPASSTSRRPCSRCPTRSTYARSTCRSSCRSSPTTSSARPRSFAHLEAGAS